MIEIENAEAPQSLEEMATELTAYICRDVRTETEVQNNVRRIRVRELLLEFAEEIKRQAIEP